VSGVTEEKVPGRLEVQGTAANQRYQNAALLHLARILKRKDTHRIWNYNLQFQQQGEGMLSQTRFIYLVVLGQVIFKSCFSWM